jgi:hypothetical protein
MTVLSHRACGRATLDRQLLLRRASISVPAAIEHLVGMQAQAPFPPYTGLWTRLADFRPNQLAELLLDRTVVRIVLMRGTVHLVTATDCLALRPVLQAMLVRTVRTAYRKQLDGLDLDAVVETSRTLIEDQPRNAAELGTLLLAKWPGRDRLALTNVARAALPLVQLPPRAVWGRSGQTVVTTAQHWLGRELAADTAPDNLVLRYLAAFGPASVADAQKWSGLTRLGEVFDRLRPGLLTFLGEDGTPLFDLPDAPRPDPGVPAPVKFLPEFDNVLLAYADTSRIMPAEHRAILFTVNGIIRSALLVNGMTAGVWKVGRDDGTAVLTVEPFRRLSIRDTSAIEAEGRRLLAFTAEDADDYEVRVLPVS